MFKIDTFKVPESGYYQITSKVHFKEPVSGTANLILPTRIVKTLFKNEKDIKLECLVEMTDDEAKEIMENPKIEITLLR